MSVLSKRSLEYISPSYPKVRSPNIFISQLSIILQIPGAAASIDTETLDRSIAMINYAEPKTLESLLAVLDLPVVTVGKRSRMHLQTSAKGAFEISIRCFLT